MENSNTVKPLISVIVCTYNRHELLKDVLQSLAGQTVDKSQYEIVVIDNNSTDRTEELVHSFIDQYPNFHYYKEPNQGLSHARNRGYKEAKSNYIGYIDDDAKAPPNWIDEIISFIRRRPDVAVFGGPYEAFTMVDLPGWFPPNYGTMNLGDVERPLKGGTEFISGTNMIYKKELLRNFEGFSKKLGMSGSKILYGEETRLQILLSENNIPVYYVPSIKVDHLIADYKLSLQWLLKSWYHTGKCAPLVFRYERSLSSHLRGLKIAFKDAVRKLRTLKNMHYKTKLYYSLAPLCEELGAFAGHIYLRKSHSESCMRLNIQKGRDHK